MKNPMLHLLLSFVLSAISALACAANVTIQLQDYRHAGVTAYIAIYAVKKGSSWGDEPVKLLQPQLLGGDMTNINTDLPPGRYALRAFVDANGNGELDTGARGKPLEPFAFSRTKGAAASLRFNAAAIEVSDNATLQLHFLHPGSRVKVEPKEAGRAPRE